MSICIQQPELTKFMDGRLPEDRADEIASHIDDCQICQDTVVALTAHDDTFVSGLRQTPASEEDQATRDPAFRHGLQRLLSRVQERQPVSMDPAPQQIGPYIIERKLGDGGMGTVYLAQHSKLKRNVALKVLPSNRWSNSEAITRFEREMAAIGGLDHPNIVRASDAGEDQGMHYLVMEFVDGLDLSCLVRRMGPLEIADACELARQAALGLQHAHDRGLVHRDVKPSNLMLAWDPSDRANTSQPVVKILDLGLALLGEEQLSEQHEVTTIGALMGTLDYMSPEQGVDSHSVDHRADIYGLGATLFKLLTGRAPYADPQYGTLMKKMTALATKPAPSVADMRTDLPKPLVEVVDRMLARDPDDRFPSVQEAAEALLGHSRGSDLQALLQSGLATPEPEPSDRRAKASVTAAPVAQATGGNHAGIGSRGFLALGLGGVFLMFALFVYRFATDYGEVTVTSSDPTLQVLLKQSDRIVEQFQVQQGKDQAEIRSGEYKIEVFGKNAEIAIHPKTVTVSRNQVAAIDVTTQKADAADWKPLVELTGPRYEGRTLSQWLDEIRYERSQNQLNTAITAMSTLWQHPENEDHVDASIESILFLMRQFGEHPISSQNEVVERAWYTLLGMPHDRVCDHLLREIEDGNRKSREFLFFLWLPVWGEFDPPIDWYNASERLKQEFARHTPQSLVALEKAVEEDESFALRFLNALCNQHQTAWDDRYSDAACRIFQRGLDSRYSFLRALSVWHLSALAPDTPGLATEAKAILKDPQVTELLPMSSNGFARNVEVHQQSIASVYLALGALLQLGAQANAVDEVAQFFKTNTDSFDSWNHYSFAEYQLPGWTPLYGAMMMGGGMGAGTPSTKDCNFRTSIVAILSTDLEKARSILPEALVHLNRYYAAQGARAELRGLRRMLEDMEPSLRDASLKVEIPYTTAEHRFIWVNGFGETSMTGTETPFSMEGKQDAKRFPEAALAFLFDQIQQEYPSTTISIGVRGNGFTLVPRDQDSQELLITWPDEAWDCISESIQQIRKELAAKWESTEAGATIEIDLTSFAKATLADRPASALSPTAAPGMGGGMMGGGGMGGGMF